MINESSFPKLSVLDQVQLRESTLVRANMGASRKTVQIVQQWWVPSVQIHVVTQPTQSVSPLSCSRQHLSSILKPLIEVSILQ